MLQKFKSLDNWSKVVVLYLWGSVFIGKASVYIGLAMGGLLLLSARVLWARWYVALTRRSDPLSPMAWALLVSLLYGFAQVIHGTLLGYPLVTALQILIFNICPAYLFLGVWVGIRYRGIIRKYMRFLAWWMVIYTPIYFIFLKNLKLSLNGIVPGTNLALLSDPGTGSVPLMGLLAFEPSLGQFWLPILVLVCLTIGYQARADWLGLGVAMIIWAKLTNKTGRFLMLAGSILGVLLFAAAIDLKLPPLPGRGGELSARGTIARMAGSVSPEMATNFGADVATARFEYGTVYWRKHWWASIRNEVSRDSETMIFGLGYGYPLGRLASRSVEEEGTRSPHNIFYFTLAYSGIVGFAIFCWLEISVFRLLWRVYKVSGETFCMIYLIYSLIGAFLGNLIETPQASIPLYLLCGMGMAPIFLQTEEVYDNEQPMPAEVAEFV